MKKLFFFLFLLMYFCLLSGQELVEIDIPGLLKPERDPLLSEIASDIQFVKLETTNECLIGSIGSVAYWGPNLLITSDGRKKLFVFSGEGKFLRSVGVVGKGPGEFLEIYGMSIDPATGHLYILDNGQVKLLEYDQEGKFLKEMKLKFYATNFKIIENGFVFYTGSVYSYRTDGYLLTVTDRNCNIISRDHQRSVPKGRPDLSGALYSDHGEIKYWERNWDTVYSFTGTSHYAGYFFNVGKNRVPATLMENPDMIASGVDGYRWIDSFRDYKNFIIFQLIDLNRRGKKLFYDKNKKTGYCIPGDMRYYDWGFYNDFCGGPLFTLENKLNDSEVACCYQIIDLKDYLSKGWIDKSSAMDPVKFSTLRDIIDKSNPDDNPVILIAKLK